jgi:hypothetical protein
MSNKEAKQDIDSERLLVIINRVEKFIAIEKEAKKQFDLIGKKMHESVLDSFPCSASHISNQLTSALILAVYQVLEGKAPQDCRSGTCSP